MTCGFIYLRYLVAHGEEGGESEAEGLRAVEGHEVAHVLEEEVLGAQEVGEREEREDHLALHLAPRVLVEAVHAGEALRGRGREKWSWKKEQGGVSRHLHIHASGEIQSSVLLLQRFG